MIRGRSRLTTLGIEEGESVWPIVLTAVVAVLALLLGSVCFLFGNGDTKNLGIGLLTGTVATAGLFAVQVSIERSKDNAEAVAKAQERKQEIRQGKQTAEQTFQLSIALTSDLTGFDPRGHSLAGTYLSGKTLNSAHLDGAHLEHAQLRGTHLRQSQLTAAHLEGANLRDADLTQAILAGANLRGAHLEGAKFALAAIEQAKSLRGATVDQNTCWPRGFLQTIALKAHLVPRAIRTDPANPVPASMGHTCKEG